VLPLALGLGLATWWVTAATRGAWAPLSAATLWSVGAILRLTGGQVTMIPDEQAVGLDGFEVEVARVCSGVDGIGLFLLFEGVWLALARGRLRFPRALVLLPIGGAAAFAVNAVRVAVLIGVGARGHEAVALGGLHSKLGWILSVGLALGSVALAERSAWLRRPGIEGLTIPESNGVPATAGAHLGPMLAALATALVTGIWARGPLDRWYVARIAAASAVLVAVRGSLPSLVPSRSAIPFLLGAGVAVVWVAGAGGDGASMAQAMSYMGDRERWAWIAIRLVGSITVIPIVEELAFRGFLLPWIVSPDVESVPPGGWTWPAVLLSSLAFGAVHSQLILGTLAGVAFAFARIWRGRLGDAIVAHAVANVGVAIAVLAGGKWGLWG
jgi:exosortase E/protease (VPEID-CTERM system)